MKTDITVPLLSAILLFSLQACSGDNSTSPANTPAEIQNAENAEASNAQLEDALEDAEEQLEEITGQAEAIANEATADAEDELEEEDDEPEQ